MPRKSTTAGQDQIVLFTSPEVPNAYRKPVQIVHSLPRAPMSMLQRKLSNAWLKNAVDTPPDKDGWYQIGTAAMSQDIGFDSNNREYLINSARELMAIVFEWDVIASEGKRAPWKASVLFPEVEVFPDVIRYQISKQLRERVLNPEIYALIDLNILRKFRRGPSIAIYEFCVRFERINKTTEVGWERFRDMVMGESSDAKSYQAYKVFKDKVLKPAVAEVNALSSLSITLQETYIGRRVNNIYFEVRRLVSQEPESPATEEQMSSASELMKFKLPQSEALALAKKHSFEEIAAAITYTRKRQADKKQAPLEKPAAYLRQALANKWGIVEDVAAPQPPKPTNDGKADRLDLESMYLVQQLKEAEGYFNELNIEDQQELVKDYNDQQQTTSLQLKASKKSGRGAQTAFFQWLAIHTWGKPTSEMLLEFATQMLRQRNAEK